MYFPVVPNYKGAPKLTAEGSPGTYKITYALGIPGLWHVVDNLDIPAIMQAGDSLLTAQEDFDLTLEFDTAL